MLNTTSSNTRKENTSKITVIILAMKTSTLTVAFPYFKKMYLEL